MSTNGSNLSKMPFECQRCHQKFSVDKPQLEISNSTFCSVVTGPHEKIIRCTSFTCRQAHVLMLGINEHSQLIWGSFPVDEDFVAKATGSSIIKPALEIVGH